MVKLATNFSEVYDLFLSQIDDYELAGISELELEEVLLRHLKNATSTLQQSVIELKDINFQEKHFGTSLEYIEIAIFAKAMKLEWVREKRYSTELMRKAIGDRDFRAVQGHPYLKELGDTEKQLRKEIREELIEFSYSDKFMSGWT